MFNMCVSRFCGVVASICSPHPLTSKGYYTCCDLSTYDLVALYGVESSSILYNMSYAMYNHVIVMHVLRFIDHTCMQPNLTVYIEQF